MCISCLLLNMMSDASVIIYKVDILTKSKRNNLIYFERQRILLKRTLQPGLELTGRGEGWTPTSISHHLILVKI